MMQSANDMMLDMLRSIQKSMIFQGYYGLPDFVIIGAQKAGTTALFDYLNLHPGVLPSKIKEVHFFDRYESRARGSDWYFQHFPSLKLKMKKAQSLGYLPLSGEATGAYLFHPYVPQLVSEFCGEFNYQPKFIVLLRNPVDRALSHYAHNCRRLDRETLSFYEALLAEDSRIASDLKIIKDNKNLDYQPSSLLRYSYAHRGLYMQQIDRWLKYFPIQNFLFINSDKMKQKPNEVVNRVFAFLGLPGIALDDLTPRHVGNYNKSIDLETKFFLLSKLRLDSERLLSFMGKEFCFLDQSND